jgi:hypothetical protein
VLSKCATNGCSTGTINISKTTTNSTGINVPGVGNIGGGTTTVDDINANFQQITPAQAATGIYSPQTTSIGSCNVFTFTQNSQSLPTITGPTFTDLNAGTITISGAASGSMTFKNGGYDLNSSTGSLVPPNGGTFNFAGGGGPDIGIFSASTTLGAPITTNVTTISTVTRSSGQAVTWSGGTPGTYVTISGFSGASINNSTTNFAGAFFFCTAPVSAGSFTVPASVLLALPPTGSITQQGVSIALPSSLSISNSSNPVTFTATGLDQGVLYGTYTVANQVTYK